MRSLPLNHHVYGLIRRRERNEGHSETIAQVQARIPSGGSGPSYSVRFLGGVAGGVTTTGGDFTPGETAMMARTPTGYQIVGLPPTDKRSNTQEQNLQVDVSAAGFKTL